LPRLLVVTAAAIEGDDDASGCEFRARCFGLYDGKPFDAAGTKAWGDACQVLTPHWAARLGRLGPAAGVGDGDEASATRAEAMRARLGLGLGGGGGGDDGAVAVVLQLELSVVPAAVLISGGAASEATLAVVAAAADFVYPSDASEVSLDGTFTYEV
jgi:hypothetical protein